jgi:hypothetical protein
LKEENISLRDPSQLSDAERLELWEPAPANPSQAVKESLLAAYVLMFLQEVSSLESLNCMRYEVFWGENLRIEAKSQRTGAEIAEGASIYGRLLPLDEYSIQSSHIYQEPGNDKWERERQLDTSLKLLPLNEEESRKVGVLTPQKYQRHVTDPRNFNIYPFLILFENLHFGMHYPRFCSTATIS